MSSAKAAMLVTIGLAPSQPMTKPWAAATNNPKISDRMTAGKIPHDNSAPTNTRVVADTVAPRLKEMTFPLKVISVMPTATQPINEAVVISASKFAALRKPGEDRAIPNKAMRNAPRRAIMSRPPRLRLLRIPND